jgi:uncharacterized protein YcgI (DUF1989 family)
MQNMTVSIPARSGAAVMLARGRSLDVINTFGQQVVDLWAFGRDDPAEFLSMEHTRSCLEKLLFTHGDTLMSNRRRPMLEIEEDTSPGVHDSLLSACDEERYRLLGVTGYHANCADNLRAACAAADLRITGVPAPWNLFENVTVENGRLRIEPPRSRPGDYVRLRACVDAVIVLSACPMDIVPTNGADRTPRAIEYRII